MSADRHISPEDRANRSALSRTPGRHMFCFGRRISNQEFTPDSEPPFAVLKAANGAFLCASGRGQLTIANMTIMAYIFKDSDLVTNLVGLIPFVDRGCKAEYNATAFVLLSPTNVPILKGTRTSRDSLWIVNLGEATQSVCTPSDGIPPPQALLDRGTYIEANFLSLHDNASYVKFVHAALGYPAPSTFLRAVTEGYITGPNQFPRLTSKMVRKHLPNAVPTAKGHLDCKPSAQPHAQSDAVSALRRHHKMNTRTTPKNPSATKKPFDISAVSCI